MKSFNLVLWLCTFCLAALSFKTSSQQSYKKMIVGKWQPVSSTAEGVEANGKRTVNHSTLSRNDVM